MSDSTVVRWTSETGELLFLGSYAAWLNFQKDASKAAKNLALKLDAEIFRQFLAGDLDE